MTPKIVVASSKQIHDFVFCEECEHRLNDGGERYILSLVPNGSTFPLRDMLATQRPFAYGPSLRYAGKSVGLNIEQLAYFAVSMVWRGAIHPWKTLNKQITGTEVISHVEEMRRYLLGEIPMPNDIGIFAILCLDNISQLHVLAPFLVGGQHKPNLFEMMIFGIVLRVGVGFSTQEIAESCLVHAPDHPLFVTECQDATIEAVRGFHENSRVAENVRNITR